MQEVINLIHMNNQIKEINEHYALEMDQFIKTSNKLLKYSRNQISYPRELLWKVTSTTATISLLFRKINHVDNYN